MGILTNLEIGACKYDASFVKKSTTENHQSKYELWDTIYVMYEDKILKLNVCAIHINIVLVPHTASPSAEVLYDLSDTDAIDLKKEKAYHTCLCNIPQNKCFATKEELLQTL